MNLRIATISMLAVAVMAGQIVAQVQVRIPSGESEIVLTVHTSSVTPAVATLLLVPGWGGGPTDVLGIAAALSDDDIGVVVLTPRGWHESTGTSTFANSLDDIGAVWEWLNEPGTGADHGLNVEHVVLGGHSWGGGMSLAYAARDETVQKVFSIAGTDHGQFIRQYASDEDFAVMVDQILASTAAPEGPIHFNVEYGLQEMEEGQDVYGLLENAGRLADHSILLVGGWEDMNVTIDHTLLPLYRALHESGADDVTFATFHADHSFGQVRPQLYKTLRGWIGH